MAQKVFIAGKTGMVGSALIRLYGSDHKFKIIVPSSSELDLTDRPAVFDYIKQTKPDLIIDAAARVAGMADNKP